MAGFLSDDCIFALNDAMGATLISGQWGLFTNNHTPTITDLLADYTELSPSDFPGYARQQPFSFMDIGTVGHINTKQFLPMTFARTAGGNTITIYGWFVTDPTGLVLYWAELFTVPIVSVPGGIPIIVGDNFLFSDRSIP